MNTRDDINNAVLDMPSTIALTEQQTNELHRMSVYVNVPVQITGINVLISANGVNFSISPDGTTERLFK